MRLKDCEIKARIPKTLKKAVTAAADARFQTESEFLRQAVLDRLKDAGRMRSDGALAA